MPVVYKYYVRVKKEDEPRLRDRLRQYNEFFNASVEIIRWAREEYRNKRRELFPEFEKVEAEYREIDERIKAIEGLVKATRKSAGAPRSSDERGKRSRGTAMEARTEVDELKDKRKAMKPRYLELKAQAKASVELKTHASWIYEQRKAKAKEARANATSFWGTRQFAAEAADAAEKGAMKALAETGKGDGLPRIKREDEMVRFGRIGASYTNSTPGGVPVSRLLNGSDTFVRIAPLPAETWDTNHGRKHAFTGLQFRIDSDEKGKPVWLNASIYMHRPLPANAKVTRVCLVAKRVSWRTTWELHLTVSEGAPHVDCGQFGNVDITLQMRRTADGGALVAVTDTGLELTLPSRVCTGQSSRKELAIEANPGDGNWIQRAASIVANNAVRDLVTCAAAGIVPQERIPGWLPKNPAEPTEKGRKSPTFALSKWVHDTVSTDWPEARDIATEWREERKRNGLDLQGSLFEAAQFLSAKGDTSEWHALLLYLEGWRRKNSHLRDWHVSLAHKSRTKRKDIYRRWARELERTFETCTITCPDLKAMAKTPDTILTSDEKAHKSAVDRLRQQVALYELKDAIRQAFGESRCDVKSAVGARDEKTGSNETVLGGGLVAAE